jgi:membrane-bound serine protease (ClpP class)
MTIGLFLSRAAILVSALGAYAMQVSAASPEAAASRESLESEPLQRVFQVPIKGQIGAPVLYVIKRAVKEAIAQGVEVLVFDMDTPGGELGATLKIMEAMHRFEGKTFIFVNREAISAGAFIAMVSDRIYFTPDGQIGAAEMVSATGQDVPDAMKRKMQSYLDAKVRVYTEAHRYRAQVMRAMTDPDFELKIGEEVLVEKGKLLSLTAAEALRAYGEPPEPLLGTGIVGSVSELLDLELGAGAYELRTFEVTWSERLAQHLLVISPILTGLGMLLLFIEFKTPNFGIIGLLGLILIALVFAGNYVAGLAGYEWLLLFLIGLLLLAVEFWWLPGLILPGFIGVVLMLGSLIWSLSDLWPSGSGGLSADWELVFGAIQQVIYSTLGAVVTLVLLWRFLPEKRLLGVFIHSDQSADPLPLTAAGALSPSPSDRLPEPGSLGVVLARLNPLGLIEVDGKRYEARSRLGVVDAGARVRVTGVGDFSLLVELDDGG